jgi:hypothetical protein
VLGRLGFHCREFGFQPGGPVFQGPQFGGPLRQGFRRVLQAPAADVPPGREVEDRGGGCRRSRVVQGAADRTGRPRPEFRGQGGGAAGQLGQAEPGLDLLQLRSEQGFRFFPLRDLRGGGEPSDFDLSPLAPQPVGPLRQRPQGRAFSMASGRIPTPRPDCPPSRRPS